MPPERGGGHVCVIAVLQSLDARHVAQIEGVDPRVQVVRVANRATWYEEAPEAEVILGFRPLGGGVRRSRTLKWVHQSGAGVEHLSADVAGTDVVVTNTHVHGDTIAEHVFALTLAHTRVLRQVVHYQSRREWAHDLLHARRLLAGATMGVLGLGTIGRAVARRAVAFGMRVWGTRRHPSTAVEGVERVLPPTGLDDVLRRSDVLVLTLPLTRETRGLVGAREFALLPRGAFLVNIGRGQLIDESALIDALQSGHLGGAGLDVFAREPLPETSPLWNLPNVILSPHVSGGFPGYMDHVVALFCDNLRRYLTGQPLRNVVDTALGY